MVQVVDVNGNPITNITKTIAGLYSSYALAADGTVWAWGQNTYGQLSDGTIADKEYAVKVKEVSGSNLSRVVQIAAGNYHFLALTETAEVWSAGYNSNGQLGNGTNSTTEHRLLADRMQNATGVTQISAGELTSYVLRADGVVWGVGKNDVGQIGNGGTAVNVVALTKSGYTDIVKIQGGDRHSLALKADGTVWASGLGTSGQIGNGASASVNSPRQVVRGAQTGEGEFLSGILDIAVNLSLNSAIDESGNVYSWGLGTAMGDGTVGNKNVPTRPIKDNGEPLTNIYKLSRGHAGTLYAIDFLGMVYGTGINANYKLLDGTTTARNRMQRVLRPKY